MEDAVVDFYAAIPSKTNCTAKCGGCATSHKGVVISKCAIPQYYIAIT